MENKIKAASELIQSLMKDKQFLGDVKKTKELLITSLENKGKILICGNGGSATQASHMAGEFVCKFYFDRPPLPAISLFDLATTTAISNDYGYDDAFSRFVDSLGKKNDVLFSLSTSGNSKNCLKAIKSAKKKEMANIALLGKDGGEMRDLTDAKVIVPSNDTPLIQEVHLMVIHYLCEEIEKHFFN